MKTDDDDVLDDGEVLRVGMSLRDAAARPAAPLAAKDAGDPWRTFLDGAARSQNDAGDAWGRFLNARPAARSQNDAADPWAAFTKGGA